MRYRVTDTHIPMPPGADREIRAALGRFAGSLREVRVRMSSPIGGVDHTATLEADVKRGNTIRISARHASARRAIRLAVRDLSAAVSRDRAQPTRGRQPRVAYRARGLARALGLTLLVGAAVMFAPAAQADSRTSTATSDKSLTETIGSSKTMQTFAKLVAKAGLSEKLDGKGEFTILVPSEAAFARLGDGTLEELVAPANRARLRAIVSNHIVTGRIAVGDLADMSGVRTLDGRRLPVAHRSGVLTVGGAVIKAANIPASNGVVHVVANVLRPVEKSVLEVAAAAGTYVTFLSLIETAGLQSLLTGEKAHTLLAPSDSAFARLPAGTLERLRKPEFRDDLVKLLRLHFIDGRVYAEDALRSGWFRVIDGHEMVDGARILATNFDAGNGVLHKIDRVLKR